MSRLKAAQGIGKIIKILRNAKAGKNPAAAKAAGKAAKSIGKSGGLLGRALKYNMIANIAESIFGGRGGRDGEGVGGKKESKSRKGKGSKSETDSSSSDDPTIDLEGIEQAVAALPVTAERTDLTAIEETPLDITIDPSPIVEGYFDNEATPVKIEKAVLPRGAEITAISNSIGAMAAQIAAMNTLADSVDNAVEENKQTKRSNERRRDEEDIEKKESPIGDYLEGMATGLAGGLGNIISKLILPALALGFADLADAFNEETDDDETNAEIIEENFGWLDDIEAKYTAAAVSFSVLGGTIKKSMAGLGLKIAKSARSLAVGLAMQGEIIRSSELMERAQKIGTNFKQLTVASKNPRAAMVFAKLNAFIGLLNRLMKAFTTPIAAVMKSLATFPAFIGKMFMGFLSRPVKWMAIFYALVAMKDAALSFMFNMISEEEFHNRMKKNINEFLGIIGGAWIISTLFAVLGGSMGTVIIPFFGTVGGAILGIILGMFFGEDLWKIIGLDDMTNAFYDLFLYKDDESLYWGAFDGMLTKILETGKKQLYEAYERVKDSLIGLVDFVVGDNIASQSSVEEKYKTDNLADIAIGAADNGLLGGTDEDSLLYVADSIRNQAHLDEVNAEMMEKHGMTLQELAASEMQGKELEQFNQVLARSLAGGGGTGVLPSDDPMPDEKPEGVAQDTYVYDVADYEGNVIGTFDSMEEANDYAMKNQGMVVSTGRKTNSEPSAAIVSLDSEAMDSVGNIIEALEYEENPVVKLESLYTAAVNVAEDGNYESVKNMYSEATNRHLVDDLSDVMGEENAIVLDKIMSSSADELPQIIADEGVDRLFEEYMPDVSSEIKEKAKQIIPIVLAGGGRPQVIEARSGVSQPSRIDSAQPTFGTTDSFLENHLVT